MSWYFFTLVTDLVSLTFPNPCWSTTIPYCLHHQDKSSCVFAGRASFCSSPAMLEVRPHVDTGRAGSQEMKGILQLHVTSVLCGLLTS